MKNNFFLREFLFCVALICVSFRGYGNALKNEKSPAAVQFKENKNQWNEQVLFKADIKGGTVFLEKLKLVYALRSLEDMDNIHAKSHGSSYNKKPLPSSGDTRKPDPVRCHALYVRFLDANRNVTVKSINKLPAYYNYFIGNDPSKWTSEVSAFEEVQYKGIYQNIDMNVYGHEHSLKYDFVINAGGSPSLINLLYEGQDSIYLSNGNLVIATSVGNMVEQKPYAYQTASTGGPKPVKCEFALAGNKVSFSFPDGYDTHLPLIIDPVVVASTYSGSSSETFGHCATYDNNGNIYTAGECFDNGYPVTPGAYQVFFGGGNVDIAISKLDPAGSALIYATYMGGIEDDYPHSLFVNGSGELYVLGSSEGGYPVTPGCYDNSFNGMTDIVISKLNASGTALIGSTYMGGSDEDGINMGTTDYNYGDIYRGEIIADAADNPYIAISTMSADFPVTAGAYSQILNGTQDACVFKMSSTLTALTWSTFLGGSDYNAGFGLRLDANNDVYVTGATTSNDFPSTAGAYQPTYQGGAADGFIAHLTNNGSSLNQSSFYGTSAFDMIYFIDLDQGNNIYVYGITDGAMTPTAGVYANPGSGQFISKLTPSLNAIVYATVLGNGTPNTL
ncbi:MAG: hypothetical protein EPN85_13420, partial [Bacteroidetes bacterium]